MALTASDSFGCLTVRKSARSSDKPRTATFVIIDMFGRFYSGRFTGHRSQREAVTIRCRRGTPCSEWTESFLVMKSRCAEQNATLLEDFF
jgi:hypothetical protein